VDVAMELSRIIITEFGDQQVIYLKETGGERTFPIVIGSMEAVAIDRRLKGQPFERPLTHDLLANVIQAMGGTVEKIVINDLRNHTFIASLYIRRGEELVEIDSRPSDAIALGAAFETPIFVAEAVLDEVLRGPETTEEKIDILRQRLQLLEWKIAEVTGRLDDEDFVHRADEKLVAEYRRTLDEMQTEYDAIERVIRKYS
jgi:hypothetical protein